MRVFTNQKMFWGGGLLVSFSIVSGALILPGFSSNISVSAETIENTPYTISAATDGNIDITVATSNATVSASHDVLVSTNCPAGYNLSIYTDNEGKIYRNADKESGYYLASTTGTLEVPVALADNQWGFSLTNPTTSGNKFAAVPLTATEIKKSTTATTTPEGDRTTVYYGVKTDGTLASGHYAGTVIYSVMPSPDCYKYTITFDTVDGGTVEDTKVTFGETIDLAALSAKVSKTGYKLTGWKDKTTGTVYGTTGTANINPNMADKINLEAIWEQDVPPFYNTTYMQDMTAQACAELTTPSKSATASDTTGAYKGNTNYVPTRTMTDKRDGNTYTIKKLADGNCWMTQNLRLVGSRTLTSADSDVSSNYTLPAAQTSAFTSSSNNNQVGAVQSSYGNGAYYSWYAATAGTGTAAMSTKGQDATSSICPKGWRLPPYSGNKSYQNLLFTTYGATNSAAGYNILVAQPLQFVLAGLYGTSGFDYGGSYGHYWSSSVNNASYAYYLDFYSSRVYPQLNGYKYYGFSVRCVAR